MRKYLSFLDNYNGVYNNCKGITVEEIQSLEAEFEVTFPAAYREYLLVFGKESGDLLSSYYTEISYLYKNKPNAIYALNFDESKDHSHIEIKDSYFFFAQWQSYIFYFFDCASNNEDPPVYIFNDSLEMFLYKESFSLFIKEEGLDPYYSDKI
jgi:hypothetical protein